MWVHPGVVILLGSLPLTFLKFRRVEQILFLSLPVVSLLILILTSLGYFGDVPFELKAEFLDYEVFVRVDKLSLVFAYVFSIAAIAMNVYALHSSRFEHFSAMVYVGSALGVVFAGDLFSFYIFWELMAVGSLFLIWMRRTKKAEEAGFRYALWHLVGGLFLLAGIVLYVQQTGNLKFVSFEKVGLAYYLILIGFIVNAAVPPLHAWLPDAYPEATVTGAVYLTAFTTKSAVYALARGFAGEELLMWLGAVMAMYGVIFAVLENDGRRLLAYHIVSQVGYMVAGVGIGTAMAINGACSHAFTHILYKALLFMGVGAVIEVTGRSKFTELGGLYRYMPITFYLYMVGAFSISAFPLFSGFVSKNMTVYASAEENLVLVWFLLEGASVGTFLHTGLKLPWNVWFSREPVIEAREPPKNMLAGMIILAALNVFFGTYPGYEILYSLLPYPVEYNPYDPAKVISMSQLLLFTFFGFWVMREKLRGEEKIVLDTDWLPRIVGDRFIYFCLKFTEFSKELDRRVLEAAGKLKAIARVKIRELTPGYSLIVVCVIFATYLMLFILAIELT
ncbi:NADH/Ubiquinone/plastoquinone (complex I) [Ferroglobus placidus DSM 10642]|uniref:NADH/Ubiquinone/plastoquinone (Complex I) n=1 Tax=Ferroglobus placidus (strain DSM 10642 / AEDII12DO) TaxID=589924 RepID=D3RWM1_FERPA|nr:Na(+)/H(+) antiporter subunit D [Ferroglobus placidus]ADC64884.1 NADH/Ubiquinone/plastoquinone (complex I) [Ferroglobus placidus DSM 10642]